MDYKNHKDYIAIESMVSSLNLQLQEIDQIPSQDITSLEKEIKEHFEACINALAQRQAFLLGQLTLLSQQRDALSKAKTEIIESIEVCKRTLTAGADFYGTKPKVAEQFWLVAISMALPTWSREELQATVSINLPTTLLDMILSHGAVEPNSKPVAVVEQINKELEQVDLGDIQNTNNELAEKVFIHSFDTTVDVEPKNIPHNEIRAPIHKNLEVDKITIIAGSTFGFKDGRGKKAQFGYPCGICFNPNNGCFYVGDASNVAIRSLTIEGNVRTFATGVTVHGIAYHPVENIYYATCDSYITKISIQGHILGTVEGLHRGAYGIAIGQKSGSIFVSDLHYNNVTMIQEGTFSLIAGTTRGFRDGHVKVAQFNVPMGIYIDEDEKYLLVCDRGNCLLRKISLIDREVSSVCYVPQPREIAVTSTHNILVATDKRILQIVTKGGKHEAMKLTGVHVSDPCGMVIHEQSNACYVSNTRSGTIVKISFL